MGTGLYPAQHATAVRLAATKGADVAFTSTDGSSVVYDPVTDAFVGLPVNATVTGAAIRVKGNPLLYQRLSLIESEAPTLFFVPDVYGQFPPLNASVTWAGVGYTVKNVDPVAPDGVVIAARVVIAR